MIDINISLRNAYKQALSGIDGVPVYYMAVPSTVSPANYIVFRSISSNDASTFNSSDTNTSVTVEIHTWTDGSNSGLSADQVAREVFNRLYANPQFVLQLDGAQMVSTRMTNDVTQNFTNSGNRTYVSRYITFKHNIFQRSDIS